MRCYFEIDTKRNAVEIEKEGNQFSIDTIKKDIEIDYLRTVHDIERCNQCKTDIDSPDYKVIRVTIPVSIDFVYLQNRFLPNPGEYFLNL